MVKPTASPAANPATKLKGDAKTSVDNRCAACKKLFHEGRIAKHQQICGTASRQRSKFDAAKHRVQGTQAEKYYKKGHLT